MAQVRKGFAVRAVCALWSWPAGAAAGCCFRVLLLEWRVHFGAGLLVPLCCQRGVCAVELACRCRCRLLQEKRRALGHLGRRQKKSFAIWGLCWRNVCKCVCQSQPSLACLLHGGLKVISWWFFGSWWGLVELEWGLKDIYNELNF